MNINCLENFSQLRDRFTKGEPFTFVKDGALCHNAWSVEASLAEKYTLLLDWPGICPNKNVPESMKRKVAKDMIINKTQLLEEIIYAWNYHPRIAETVEFFIDS